MRVWGSGVVARGPCLAAVSYLGQPWPTCGKESPEKVGPPGSNYPLYDPPWRWVTRDLQFSRELDQASLSWLAQDPKWGYFRQQIGNLLSVAKMQKCFALPPDSGTHIHTLTYSDMDMYADLHVHTQMHVHTLRLVSRRSHNCR